MREIENKREKEREIENKREKERKIKQRERIREKEGGI